MALFALYRILPEDRMHVFLSDIRPDGHSVQHYCTLRRSAPNAPNALSRLGLVKELTEELERMGFPLEFDRRFNEEGEIRFFCVHQIPGSAPSSVGAIGNVYARHGITAPIVTHMGQLLFVPAKRQAGADDTSNVPCSTV